MKEKVKIKFMERWIQIEAFNHFLLRAIISAIAIENHSICMS